MEAGGRPVGVLANGLERAALNRNNRDALLDGRLVMICPRCGSLGEGWIEMTIPDKPSSVNQRYRLTSAGRNRLSELGLPVAPR